MPNRGLGRGSESGRAVQSAPFVRGVDTSSVDGVLAEIRRSIVLGVLAPGQEFALRETAAQLGVSTAPVRAALQVLQSEGLIVTGRARSAVVAETDPEDLRAIYRLRRRIEPALAAESCECASDAHMAKLVELHEVASAAAERRTDQSYETHRQFHLAMLRPAATAWDLRVIDILWQAAERYVRIAYRRRAPLPAELTRRIGAHLHLLETFRTRDAERVRAALVEHLHQNESLATRALAP